MKVRQFFINTVDNAYLDFRSETRDGWGYCVFGKVTEGTDTVEKIEKVKTVIDDLAIRSPVDGHVEYRLADPGNVIGSGSRVMAVLDPLDVTMDVFLPSKDAVKVRVGDEARIVIDGVDAVFPAKVDFVADDAQFTPKFVETREERDKLRFRVILKVSPDTASANPRYLKGGMPAVAYLRTENTSWPGNLAVKLPEESAGKSQASAKD